MRIRHILVPTDFSQPADAAWQYAQGLATTFHSRVLLLHVINLPSLSDTLGTETVALRMADLLTQSQAAAERALQRLVPKRGPLAGRVRTMIMTGVTVRQIMAVTTARKIDLIVMGTHGRGLIERLALGSVAERVVRRSPVPVVTMHGRARGKRSRAA